MDLSTQAADSVATSEHGKYGNRTFLLKVQLNAREKYLYDDVHKKLGFADRTTTIRWLLNHFQALYDAELVVKAYKDKMAADAEFHSVVAAFENMTLHILPK